MKPGKRNCGRRRRSVWRGGCRQRAVSFSFPVSVAPAPEIWPPSLPSPPPPPPFSLPGVLSVCDNPPEAPSVSPPPPFFLTPPALSCLTYFTCPSHFPCSHSVSFRYSLRRRRSAEHQHPSDTSAPPRTHSLVRGCRRQPCRCLSIKCHRCQSPLSHYTWLVNVARHQILSLDFGIC